MLITVLHFTILAVVALNGSPTYYVSLSGDNTTGLTWETAFTEVQNALDIASSEGTARIPATVVLDGNVFESRNGLFLRENVQVKGQGAGATVIRSNGTIEMQPNCHLADLSIEAVGVPVLVSIVSANTGPVSIRHCIIDGEYHWDKDAAAPSVGILIYGGTYTSAQISDCGLSTLDIGILAVDSGVNITRCLFHRIREDAVRATSSNLKETNQVPMMGIAADSDNTGLNWYRDVSGFCVNNQTDTLIRAEINDWYVYQQQEVMTKVNGPVDTEPFLGKSIGQGSVVATLKDAQNREIPESKHPSCRIPSLNIEAQFDRQSGKHIMNSVPPGSQLVKATAAGYSSTAATINVQPLTVTPVTLTLGQVSCGKEGKIAYSIAMLLLFVLPARRRMR